MKALILFETKNEYHYSVENASYYKPEICSANVNCLDCDKLLELGQKMWRYQADGRFVFCEDCVKVIKLADFTTRTDTMAAPDISDDESWLIQAAQNWQANAIAAEELWAAKVAEAASNRTRAKKIAQVSDSEWKQRASELGSARIAAGMTAAEGKFRKGMADVLATIESVTIGARTADPMANIDARVKPIEKALNDMKRK